MAKVRLQVKADGNFITSNTVPQALIARDGAHWRLSWGEISSMPGFLSVASYSKVLVTPDACVAHVEEIIELFSTPAGRRKAIKLYPPIEFGTLKVVPQLTRQKQSTK